MRKKDRHREIVRLWLQRPEDKRTGTDLYVFCMELQRDFPELLDAPRYGDPCQGLKVSLSGHIHEPH